MSKSYVIIFSEPDDFHAISVGHYLYEFGVEVIYVDLKNYPSHMFISHDPLNSHYGIIYKGLKINVDEIVGIWVRRPTGIVVSTKGLSHHDIEFSRLQCLHALRGWLCSFSNIINPILEDERARYKPYQLDAAKNNGLTIPQTLITNNPDDAFSFFENMDKKVIFKPLAAHKSNFLETRELREEHLDKLPSLTQGPVIFQQKIERGKDYRVTCIDGKIFTTTITPTTLESQLDWRLDDSAIIEIAHLSEPENKNILKFMKHIGLRYGALDFRRCNDGLLYFLEVNSGGQFLFNDIQAGTEIAPAIASALANET